MWDAGTKLLKTSNLNAAGGAESLLPGHAVEARTRLQKAKKRGQEARAETGKTLGRWLSRLTLRFARFARCTHR